MKPVLLSLLIVLGAGAAFAQQQPEALPSLVDFDRFVAVSQEVQTYRQTRLLPLADFLSKAEEPGVILLDTRSQQAYEGKHLKGAIHLNFSDFTTEKLAKLIPDTTTTILIYCNNNLEGDREFFAAKSPPLALNIPTFINLYGYGYRNIYELRDLIPVDDPRLTFEGTEVVKK